MSGSWKVEVQADRDDSWSHNQLRFPSKVEADDYGRDLYARWTAVRQWRSVKSPDPVNRTIKEGKFVDV